MSKIKIAIDPGHGMSSRTAGVLDPGAIGLQGLREADIVLQWALTGKFVLEQQFGFEVHLTRLSNSDPAPLGTRDDIANKNGCVAFISLHCNASAAPQANGAETFYRDAKDQDLAKAAQNILVRMGMRNRGVKSETQSQHKSLAVFNFKGPATLIELGFITNQKDVKFMTDRETRIKFWEAMGAELKKRYN